MKNDWLKLKRYPHIGNPLTKKDSFKIERYVTNPKKVAEHRFTPLIHRVIRQRKYRPEENAKKNKFGKRARSVKPPKERHIYFPCHLDSLVYSYYNQILITNYENYLKTQPFNNSIVAYRKIPKSNNLRGNKCNIEFANEAFMFIKQSKYEELSVIIADITSFFDNLDHKILHKQWNKILGTNELPKDHYNLYKSLIKKRYVNEPQLFNKFKNKLIVERVDCKTNKKKLRNKKVTNFKNFRKERVVAYCSKKDFFSEATNLIIADKPYNKGLRQRKKKDPLILKGIPQGTPISATLANIYMLDFDTNIYNEISNPERLGFYQRYSDDLIIVCNKKDESFYYNLITRQIQEKSHLKIQRAKTNIYRYKHNKKNNLVGGKLESENEIEKVNPNYQVEYLGFMFDGTCARIKTASFSKFYRNMKHSFRRGTHYAKSKFTKSDKLFENRLYKRFTHLGAKRRLKYKQDLNNPKKWERTTEYDWGNFISYVYKSNKVMQNINGNNTIKRQTRRFWKNFQEIKETMNKEIKSKKR